MDGSPQDLAIFILAGGKSTRMGADKAFLEFEGRTLLARALDLARSLTADVRVAGSAEKFAALAPVVEDVFPGCGPLAGIHAALRVSSADLNLMLAVDMPFVPVALLHYLIQRANESPEAVVTVPRADGGWQPLCAIYHREFAEAAEHALRQGRYKIDPLFGIVRTQTIEEQELRKAGFSPDVFRNLNTRADVGLAANETPAPKCMGPSLRSG